MKKIITISLTYLIWGYVICQEGSFKDERDGRVYQTVKIGDQVWMAENLDVEYFKNGDLITQAKTKEEWYEASKNEQPAWCYYDNDPSIGKKCGKLYNWYAVNDSRGLAPKGFHIPSDDDLLAILYHFGSDCDAVTKMKSDTGWKEIEDAKDKSEYSYYENGNGTNTSGFSCLPCGSRGGAYHSGSIGDQEIIGGGNFYSLGSSGCFWSSTIEDVTKPFLNPVGKTFSPNWARLPIEVTGITPDGQGTEDCSGLFISIYGGGFYNPPKKGQKVCGDCAAGRPVRCLKD